MTDKQRRRAKKLMNIILVSDTVTISDKARRTLQAYHDEHERMRQFIRNLADESRVYLESEE